MKLKIADDLSLPLDVVTQTIAVLAKRRAGKSYTMRRLTEQLFKAGQQIVMVDPKGDQWGIRSAADGKAPGLPIVILGGERGDVPLESGGGEVVAKLVVEERVGVLLDLSLFRKHEVATFMTAFLENLYRLKAREVYRTPMMLVIDEADAIAPQKPQKGEERMLGAAEDIVRRGGQRGIGCVLVTQRSAVLNKNVLTQAQMLVALRTIAPQDLAAMNSWIDVHGTIEEKHTLMESLPSLPVGDAWFWSPGWPTVDGIFKRVHVLPIETFDSGATPKPGQKMKEPKRPADVDLDALKRQMAATIEKAKADDPRELKKKIAEFERQAKQKTIAIEAPKAPAPFKLPAQYRKALEEAMKFTVKVEAIDVIVDSKTIVEGVERAVTGALERINREIAAKIKAAKDAGIRVRQLVDKLDTGTIDLQVSLADPSHVPAPSSRKQNESFHKKDNLSSGADNSSHAGIIGGALRILSTLVSWHPEGLPEGQMRAHAGMRKSGTYSTYLSRLRTAGFIEQREGKFFATEAGIEFIGDRRVETPTTTEEVVALWKPKLAADGAKRMLDVLVGYRGEPISKEDLFVEAGFKGEKGTSGTFSTYMSRLRTARLLVDVNGMVAANKETLFL
jgi:hypothetical protein